MPQTEQTKAGNLRTSQTPPPYTYIKVYLLVAFLNLINLPSLEMKPYLGQCNPTSVSKEARPTPHLPIAQSNIPTLLYSPWEINQCQKSFKSQKYSI